jgi:hypothetical protein
MDIKQLIVGRVHQIDDLRAQVVQHWSMVQQSVKTGDIDAAIPLLNAYFALKVKLEGAESGLESMLKGQFSDR